MFNDEVQDPAETPAQDGQGEQSDGETHSDDSAAE